MKPLCIDLFCGLGGWTEGFLAEGYTCIGFDIERHVYGDLKYPGELCLQDVTTLHGSQFKDAAVIVASPPCQEFSSTGLPFKQFRGLIPDRTLFDACFRIQREASEAAGRHVPLVVENVRAAQKWVGRAAWSFGSFYLWGNIPALMPQRKKVEGRKLPGNNSPTLWKDRRIARLKDAVNHPFCWGSSGSKARKANAAVIAKIPLPLARHIARTYYPMDP